MSSFEQAKGQKGVSAPATGAKMGPSGDTCHMQIASGAGSDKPMRKKTMGPMGYSVTSPAPTPSSTRDLKSRP
ncbi:MAG: hypothetical protein WCA15_20565 [Candidatus Acidiferrales bacterium]